MSVESVFVPSCGYFLLTMIVSELAGVKGGECEHVSVSDPDVATPWTVSPLTRRCWCEIESLVTSLERKRR